MLELAKVVYTKQLAEAKEEDKLAMLEKLCCTMCALGEVSIESENYKQAVEDFQECLFKQSAMPKDSRYVSVSTFIDHVLSSFLLQVCGRDALPAWGGPRLPRSVR